MRRIQYFVSMSTSKFHNKAAIYSNAVFFAAFICWIVALWLAGRYAPTPASLEIAVKWIDNLCIIPFGVGAYLGLKGIYQKNSSPLFPFMGFVLNGIMVFRIVNEWLIWAFGW